jgi:hypothetical protein
MGGFSKYDACVCLMLVLGATSCGTSEAFLAVLSPDEEPAEQQGRYHRVSLDAAELLDRSPGLHVLPGVEFIAVSGAAGEVRITELGAGEAVAVRGAAREAAASADVGDVLYGDAPRAFAYRVTERLEHEGELSFRVTPLRITDVMYGDSEGALRSAGALTRRAALGGELDLGTDGEVSAGGGSRYTITADGRIDGEVDFSARITATPVYDGAAVTLNDEARAWSFPMDDADIDTNKATNGRVGFGVKNTGLLGANDTTSCWGSSRPERDDGTALTLKLGHLWHAGADRMSWSGKPVYAVGEGVVRLSNNRASYPGGVVVIEHRLTEPERLALGISGDRIYSQYGHVSASVSACDGDYDALIAEGTESCVVGAGDQIATIIDRGSNTHLHWEIRTQGSFDQNVVTDEQAAADPDTHCASPGTLPATYDRHTCRPAECTSRSDPNGPGYTYDNPLTSDDDDHTHPRRWGYMNPDWAISMLGGSDVSQVPRGPGEAAPELGGSATCSNQVNRDASVGDCRLLPCNAGSAAPDECDSAPANLYAGRHFWAVCQNDGTFQTLHTLADVNTYCAGALDARESYWNIDNQPRIDYATFMRKEYFAYGDAPSHTDNYCTTVNVATTKAELVALLPPNESVEAMPDDANVMITYRVCVNRFRLGLTGELAETIQGGLAKGAFTAVGVPAVEEPAALTVGPTPVAGTPLTLYADVSLTRSAGFASEGGTALGAFGVDQPRRDLAIGVAYEYGETVRYGEDAADALTLGAQVTDEAPELFLGARLELDSALTVSFRGEMELDALQVQGVGFGPLEVSSVYDVDASYDPTRGAAGAQTCYEGTISHELTADGSDGASLLIPGQLEQVAGRGGASSIDMGAARTFSSSHTGLCLDEDELARRRAMIDLGLLSSEQCAELAVEESGELREALEQESCLKAFMHHCFDPEGRCEGTIYSNLAYEMNWESDDTYRADAPSTRTIEDLDEADEAWIASLIDERVTQWGAAATYDPADTQCARAARVVRARDVDDCVVTMEYVLVEEHALEDYEAMEGEEREWYDRIAGIDPADPEQYAKRFTRGDTLSLCVRLAADFSEREASGLPARGSVEVTCGRRADSPHLGAEREGLSIAPHTFEREVEDLERFSTQLGCITSDGGCEMSYEAGEAPDFGLSQFTLP